MKQEEHRLGVSEVNLVVRHLKLDAKNVSNINDAITEIDKLYGLDGGCSKFCVSQVTSQYERLAVPRSGSTAETVSDSSSVPDASNALTFSKYRHTAA